ncbi:MAG TPA: rhodanese-like domain-containing protein [Candidatus Limiplasma sp.]|nr:rhodanese-like domain-containing protein [Candidatus Limiplasma sp.]
MQRNRWKKPFLVGLACVLTAMTLSACSGPSGDVDQNQATGEDTAVYHKISAEEAKTVMDSEENIIVLDVREQSEYDTGHIPNATLLPVGEIAAKAATVLPDKSQKILVYCRSGNRSRTAANELVSQGYTQVYDFGGIIDWPYDVVK